MFERFTDRARRVLVLAQEESRLLNHSFIGTEHILLGLIHEGEGVAAKALEQLGIGLEDAREQVEEMIGLSGSAPIGSPPFTPRAKKVLELALREALQLGHNYIGTEHMLLGLVREGEGVAAQVLVSLGADLALVRQTVLQLLSGYRGGEATGGGVQSVTGGTVRSRSRANLVACSFCGRRPPETGQLVSGNRAFICEQCIAQWAARLKVSGTEGQDLTNQPLFPAHTVEGTGPPPEDQEAARAEIFAAFAAHGTPSEDGRSLPKVEGGEILGPCIAEALRRHPRFSEGGSEALVEVQEITFVDAEHAAVWFNIVVDDRALLHDRRGDAVLVEGEWRMARSTFCDLMRLAGVDCPPPTEPGS